LTCPQQVTISATRERISFCTSLEGWPEDLFELAGFWACASGRRSTIAASGASHAIRTRIYGLFIAEFTQLKLDVDD
jgi:hypothetical protein